MRKKLSRRGVIFLKRPRLGFLGSIVRGMAMLYYLTCSNEVITESKEINRIFPQHMQVA